MDLKWCIAFVLALAIGGLCRIFDIPVPAPPTLLGGLLVFSTTVGYWAAGFLLLK